MPTIPHRAHFARRAIEYWLRQDYQGFLELVVVADQRAGLQDTLPSYLPPNRRIKLVFVSYDPSYMDVSRRSNAGHAAATGVYRLPWDDDDWHAPHRVSYAVQQLHPWYPRAHRAGLRLAYYWRLGDPTLLVCDLGGGKRRHSPAGITGHYATMVFSKTCVDRAPFDESIQGGSDYAFQVDKARRQDLFLELTNPSYYVVIRHGRNHWQTDYSGPAWSVTGLAPEDVMGADAAWYRSLVA